MSRVDRVFLFLRDPEPSDVVFTRRHSDRLEGDSRSSHRKGIQVDDDHERRRTSLPYSTRHGRVCWSDSALGRIQTQQCLPEHTSAPIK